MELKDVAKQGVFDCLQLAERATVGHLFLALEEHLQRINCVNLLHRPLGK